MIDDFDGLNIEPSAAEMLKRAQLTRDIATIDDADDR